MIAYLHGVLRAKHPLEVVIDVHGMAFEVLISTRTYERLPDLNELCKIFTHLVWREDQQYLVGFHNNEDRAWFRRLIKVTGIGPKVALAILSTLTPSQLRQSIEAQDSARLTRVPGIGKKTAERILLEFNDPRIRQWMQRLSGEDISLGDITPILSSTSIQDDLNDALMALGYSSSEIEKTLKRLPADGQLDALLRQALQHLSGQR